MPPPIPLLWEVIRARKIFGGPLSQDVASSLALHLSRRFRPLLVIRRVYTLQRFTEDRFLLARGDLDNRIAVLMGGRAAEALIFDGEVSTGASDDLQRATEIGTEMVTRYGMAETIGARTYAPPPQPFLAGTTANRAEASEATAREIDIAVRDIVAKALDRASEVLRARRADLDKGARLLLAQETVTADQFPALRSAGTEIKSAA